MGEHTEQIDLIKDRDSFLRHLLLHTMSDWLKTAGRERDTVHVFVTRVEVGVGTFSDVHLVINGVDAPLRPFVEHLESQFKDMVERKASLMLRERFLKIEDYLARLERSMRAEFPELADVED
jgi:hypothetical protein